MQDSMLNSHYSCPFPVDYGEGDEETDDENELVVLDPTHVSQCKSAVRFMHLNRSLLSSAPYAKGASCPQRTIEPTE